MELTVDHVTPQALVEDDATTNLVTACKDCNSGKSSVPPDAPLVADVEEKALQWSRAMNTVLEQRAAERAGEQVHLDRFDAAWKQCVDGVGDEFPRDPDWRTTIRGYLAQGLDHADFLEAIDIAMSKRDVRWDAKWKYFNGCCRNVAKDIVDRVAAATKGPALASMTSSYINEDGFDEGQFPEFEVLCEYLEHLVRALGGDAQVAKYVDRTVGEALSVAHNAWFGGIRDGEDPTDRIRASVRDAAAGNMAEIRKWRERRDLESQFPALNLGGAFAEQLAEAFDATAEDRSMVKQIFWGAARAAYDEHMTGRVPTGFSHDEWIELCFSIEVESGLEGVGESRNHAVTRDIARQYVEAVLGLSDVSVEFTHAASLIAVVSLEVAGREYQQACSRHHDITHEKALEQARIVLDEWLGTELPKGINDYWHEQGTV